MLWTADPSDILSHRSREMRHTPACTRGNSTHNYLGLPNSASKRTDNTWSRDYSPAKPTPSGPFRLKLGADYARPHKAYHAVKAYCSHQPNIRLVRVKPLTKPF